MASRFLTRSLRSFNSLINQNARMSLLSQAKPKLGSFSLINVNNRAFSASSVSLQQSSVFKDLTSFLSQEIKLEKESRKNLPNVTGFTLNTDGPNVTLTKSHNDETITVKFNVNGSLDNNETVSDETVENEKGGKEPEVSAMKSRPHFSVDIKRGSHVLSFGCSFLPTEGEKDISEDFQIDELAIHGGEWNENVYTADCSVLDGQLYDILLNLLDERGVGEKFANELTEFSTAYEHHQYIGLLEKLENFSK
jgi:complement component 1 Q subcomponent-binding protein, mitochondrial